MIIDLFDESERLLKLMLNPKESKSQHIVVLAEIAMHVPVQIPCYLAQPTVFNLNINQVYR